MTLSPAAAQYAAARQALLDRIVAAGQADERFVAAWLRGSLGRGQGDAFSDLDLTLVVADGQRDALCNRPWMVGAGTTARRLAVFQQFGTPAIIHENHHNAPPRGTFTFVLYAELGLMVDWVFVPLSDARSPAEAAMLFARQAIPPPRPAPPDTLPRRVDLASERVSFFWMLAAHAAKLRARGDVVNFHVLLDRLLATGAEVRALLAGEVLARHSGPAALLLTPEAQAEALRAVCQPVDALGPELLRLGGHVPPAAYAAIEQLLQLR